MFLNGGIAEELAVSIRRTLAFFVQVRSGSVMKDLVLGDTKLLRRERSFTSKVSLMMNVEIGSAFTQRVHRAFCCGPRLYKCNE